MSQCNILLVDDDPVVRTLLQKRLLAAGYHVTIASNGNQAITELKKKQFDIIITDLIMPGGIDGIALLQWAKKEHNSTEVILITGHSSIGKAVEAMQKGATDYLEKPINIDELFLRLDKIYQLKSLVRNAGDIREAMDTTIMSAADTIQHLEIEIFELRNNIESIKSIFRDTKNSTQEIITKITDIIDQ